VQELNFPELAIQDVKLKIKTFRIRCAAEQAKVRKWQKKKECAGLHDIYVSKFIFCSNFHRASPANYHVINTA
jgi:hypothetical protein